MTHMPGPWKILRQDLGDEEIFFVPVEILAGNGKLVVAYEGGLAPNQEWTCEEVEGNASLIESAPDMLEALEQTYATIENRLICPFCGCAIDHRHDCIAILIQTAIRKARGDLK